MTSDIRVKQTSPRHGFPYSTYPTVKGSMYGGGGIYPNRCGATRARDDYGMVLDSVYEMTRDTAEGNGTTYVAALAEVLKAQSWRVLPSHQKLILARLENQ